MNAQRFNNWLYSGTAKQMMQPLVMGILNLTPDSFSDGGRFNVTEKAYAKAMEMLAEGADIIDIGAESSRPGAARVSIDEEIERIKPLLQKLRKATEVCLSIDTVKPEVMRVALDLGIDMINDVSALQQEAAIELLHDKNVPICLMHQSRQHQCKNHDAWIEENDILGSQIDFFDMKIRELEERGFSRKQFLLDPGVGFGKIYQDNLRLIKHIEKLKQFDLPLLIGISRKSFIGSILDKPVDERLFGGLAVTAYTYLQGVSIHRTHDVKATRETLSMLKAILIQDLNND